MIKDYANLPSKKPRRPIITTIVLITCAILIPLTMFLGKIHHALHHKKNIEMPLKKDFTSASAPENQSQFEFYTLLPKMEVPVDNNAEQSKAKSSAMPANLANLNAIPSPSVTEQNINYALQVASLQNLSDAQRLRGQLFTQGFQSSFIQAFAVQKTIWYRVYLGPYSSLSMTQNDQKRLQLKTRLNSLLVRIKSVSNYSST